MNTKLPETIEDAKEELAELFFQCARYERNSTDWVAALNLFTEQTANAAVQSAESRHAQELLAQDITLQNMAERHAQELAAYELTVANLRAERFNGITEKP